MVLKTAAIPAVLLEAGVIANRQDEEMIEKPATRQAIAAAISKALSACSVLPASD